MASFQNEIDNCLSFIRSGKIILYPTDTVWGIGCDALNESVVDKIFEIKQRPRQKSLIILLSDVSELSNYTDQLTDFMLQQIISFTTPTTVVLSEAQNLPRNVINEDGSVAIRITKDPFCKSIIDALGRPVISTSANISGADTPAIFKQIAAEIVEAVDYVTTYRQGDETITTPSRIVRFEQDGTIVYLR
jgi:L-threonylcarbamoyladenylate synthase